MDMQIKNKVALITGGSRGIGREIGFILAEHGAKIAFCGRKKSSLDLMEKALGKRGTEAWGFQTDVSKLGEIETLVEHIASKIGGVDILVNNAVTSESAPFDELSDKMFSYHIDVKLMAYIRLARLLLPLMKNNGSGRIINIGGMTARIVAPLRITNGVVNAGIANFTKQFAAYAAQYNVTVNCVHPGYTVTERVMQIFEKEAKETGLRLEAVIENRTAEIPLGKLIEPGDIASAVLFFCSPLASMITGQSLAVDGGSGSSVNY